MQEILTGKQTGVMEFIEEIGLLFEDAGFPRMAGRMMGWLLVCNPPHQSFTDMVGVLQASKGSISSTTRLLVQVGVIERFSIPGDRQTYYRIRGDAWQEVLQKEFARTKRFTDVSARGLSLLKDESEEIKGRLKQMHQFYSFISTKMPAILQEYNEEN